MLGAVKRPIVVAMSGGLDSSVSAMLLRQQGHRVIGVFMDNWDRADEAGSENTICPTDKDYEDVQEVCGRLHITELHRVSFRKQYWNEVFTPYIEDYSTGLLTPNPDVDCNRHIKFDYLRRYINENIGEYKIATGHYARIAFLPWGTCHHHKSAGLKPVTMGASPGICNQSDRALLLTARDDFKDQTYFLSTIRESHLRQFIFPLGNYRKADVKALANSTGSPLIGAAVLSRKESMGVCFIGKRALPAFLSNYIHPTPGRYVDIDSGSVLGPLTGVQFLTCGQRVRVSGIQERYFVCKKIPLIGSDSGLAFGDVLACKGVDHPALFTDSLLVQKEGMKFISAAALSQLCAGIGSNSPAEYFCKSRSYSKAMRRCRVELVVESHTTGCRMADPQRVADAMSVYEDYNGTGSGSEETAANASHLPFTHYKIIFLDGPERAVTPGQVCVLYRRLSIDEVAIASNQLTSSPIDDSKAIDYKLNENIMLSHEDGTENSHRECLMECLGGGKITAPGPSYYELGKKVPPALLPNEK